MLGYMVSNLRNVQTPFDAHLVDKNFFEGWYFKFVSADESKTCFIICGVYRAPSKRVEDSHSFIMFWLSDNMSQATYYRYPTSLFSFDKTSKIIKVGGSIFSLNSVRVSLDSKDVWHPSSTELKVYHNETGRTITHSEIDPTITIEFNMSHSTPFPSSKLSSGVMGITGLVPFLTCYHGIGSLLHQITGKVTIGSKNIDFGSGSGYIEKDWGRCFPQHYIWTQCHTFKDIRSNQATAPVKCTFLFSIASIPLPMNMGRFPGFLILLNTPSKLHNFSTYTLSSFKSLVVTQNQTEGGLEITVKFVVKKGTLTLSGTVVNYSDGSVLQASHLKGIVDGNKSSETVVDSSIKSSTVLDPSRTVSHASHLRAPVEGSMKMHVQEWNSATVHLKLTMKGEKESVLFEGVGTNAGLEVEGDMEWLIKVV